MAVSIVHPMQNGDTGLIILDAIFPVSRSSGPMPKILSIQVSILFVRAFPEFPEPEGVVAMTTEGEGLVLVILLSVAVSLYRRFEYSETAISLSTEH